MSRVKDLVRDKLNPVSESELDEFGQWAFGDLFKNLNGSLKFMEAWNENHGSELRLKPDGFITEDVEKIVKLWKEYKVSPKGM